jgi:hypothetical protein
MLFGLGILLFIIGSGVIALCLVAIPGPGGTEMSTHGSHSHGH